MLPSVSTPSARTWRPPLRNVPRIASATRAYSPLAGPVAMVVSSWVRARRRWMARSACSSSSEMMASERESMPGGPTSTTAASWSRQRFELGGVAALPGSAGAGEVSRVAAATLAQPSPERSYTPVPQTRSRSPGWFSFAFTPNTPRSLPPSTCARVAGLSASQSLKSQPSRSLSVALQQTSTRFSPIGLEPWRLSAVSSSRPGLKLFSICCWTCAFSAASSGPREQPASSKRTTIHLMGRSRTAAARASPGSPSRSGCR